ncbi:MAG TPA: hypothetical protein VJB13_00565 [Candidatus Nanoarchaeia archaeon]|nr:hypothetical protein [Candidatus Nanoarchaeia archaeon]
MVSRKIKVCGNTFPKIDHAKVAEGLGAKIISVPEISRKESQQYQPLGMPFMVSDNDPSLIYNIGAKMLQQQGFSLDDVVGYRVLDMTEELEFRRRCQYRHSTVVRYYAKKE